MTALSEKAAEYAGFIEHTMLKPEAAEADIRRLCAEALKYRFHSVCVNPCNVPLCAGLLGGSPVKVCSVAGFPLGAAATETKAFEAAFASAAGADEIDMVMNIGALKSGDEALVYRDIKTVRAAVRGKVLKVILETALLTRREKIAACGLAKKAGADYVKTSTGFSAAGATVSDVRLLRRAVGQGKGVKASGGIKDAGFFLELIRAGASRIGTSNSVRIIKALAGRAGQKANQRVSR